MPVTTAQDLVEALRALPLLEPIQMQKLTVQLLPTFPDLKSLARELLQRQWLTAYQINQLARGKGSELVLDHYVLQDLLGQGGMGQVFRARHVRLKRLCALKVILPSYLSSPHVLARFQREVMAAALLDHPNIVHVHDAGEWHGVHYLAMEYVEGTDLGKLLKKGGVLPIPAACDYVLQACLGLQHAHEQGLVHRDIKPSNLILTTDGVVKILDMGLAHIARPELTGQDQQAGSLTATGTIMGTPDYLAPEQGRNAKLADIRSDLYSLGCALYHLLAGKVPFPVDNMVEKLLCHQLNEPQPVEEVRASLPAGLGDVVRALMAKDPAERFQTPAEAAAALLPFSGEAGAAVAVIPVPVKSNPEILGIGPDSKVPGSKPQVELATMPPNSNQGTDETTFPPAQVEVNPLAELGEAVRSDESRPDPPDRVEAQNRTWLLALAVVLVVVLLGVTVWRSGLGRSKSKAPQGGKEQKEQKGQDSQSAGSENALTNDIGMELVLFRADKFLMGSPKGEVGRTEDEEQHQVTLTRDFYLGKYPVTQEQYQAVMGTNPNQFAASGADKDKVVGQDTKAFPVERVSWEEAVKFCDKLTEKEKGQGRVYRLPTEAEWEYACRAGTTTPFNFGKELNGKQANCDGNYPYGTDVKGPRLGRTSKVGSYPPNPWGLCDMHGNIRQWCSDYYNRDYDLKKTTDPTGPTTGNFRVLRGGSWEDFPKNCRSAYRESLPPNRQSGYAGLRVVLVPPSK